MPLTIEPYRVILMQGERFVAVEIADPTGQVMDMLRAVLDRGIKVGQGQVATSADVDRIFALEGAHAGNT